MVIKIIFSIFPRRLNQSVIKKFKTRLIEVSVSYNRKHIFSEKYYNICLEVSFSFLRISLFFLLYPIKFDWNERIYQNYYEWYRSDGGNKAGRYHLFEITFLMFCIRDSYVLLFNFCIFEFSTMKLIDEFRRCGLKRECNKNDDALMHRLILKINENFISIYNSFRNNREFKSKKLLGLSTKNEIRRI